MEKVTDPAELCGMRLKNHLVRSATWFGLCRPDGTLLPEMYERYETLAAGGVGMIITELTDVSEWNNAIGDNMRLYSDRLNCRTIRSSAPHRLTGTSRSTPGTQHVSLRVERRASPGD